jgi:hypothetical protein
MNGNKLPTVTLLLLALAFFVAVPGGMKATPAPGASGNSGAEAAEDLQQAIRRFVQTLSAEKGFESWKNASWTSYPLGPGLHGWVVILSAGGAPVGYLVIHATPDGSYALGEYGSGESPLFGMAALHQSLIRQQLLPPTSDLGAFASNPMLREARIYIDAMHAVWRLEFDGQVHLFDAKTGEQYPVSDVAAVQSGEADGFAGPAVRAGDRVRATVIGNAFDPYENLLWMIDPPLSADMGPSWKESWETSLKELLKKSLEEPGRTERTTFVAKLFGGQVTKPLAVRGYQEWEQAEPFIIVEDEGPRYIPLSVASRLGHFYRQSS